MLNNNNGNGAVAPPVPPAVEARRFFQLPSFNEVSPERIVAHMLEHAVSHGASDMYFEFYDDDVEVTIRHLGIIRTMAVLERDVGLRCVTHIRTMGQLKLTDRRHPQDGRWVYRLESGRLIDLRVSTIPTLYGESLSLRILERDSHLQQLDSLGLVGSQMGALISTLHSPSGLVLVTGPTGSGKTTTLYACLHYLNDGSRKIHTLEDPVEYAVRGLHQTQVDSHVGADFQEMLRGVLRQGPDVVLIGEVRDTATAETAVRAANSGQLVFASLHAPQAAAALQSMLSLGVSGYFLCTSLVAVIAQRLIRTLNPKTAVPLDLSFAPRTFEEVAPWLADAPPRVFAPGSSPDGADGYAGRSGVFEILRPSSTLRQLIAEERPASVLFEQAVKDGMLDFRKAALLKVAMGLTTFDELQRIVPASDDERVA